MTKKSKSERINERAFELAKPFLDAMNNDPAFKAKVIAAREEAKVEIAKGRRIVLDGNRKQVNKEVKKIIKGLKSGPAAK